jgi:hypothetical protein
MHNPIGKNPVFDIVRPFKAERGEGGPKGTFDFVKPFNA